MGIPINIEELLYQRVIESTRIEYKKDWNPNAIIHTICAFANDIDNVGGGYIIIGVEEENGIPKIPVLGIEENTIDCILKELVQYCHYIEPIYNPIVEPVLYKEKYIIVIWVPGGYGRPYKASKDVYSEKSNKLYYIRKFSSTIIASSEEEKLLYYVSSNIPFDDRPNLAADIYDLDISLMRKHLKEVESNLYEISLKTDLVKLANDMHLVSGPPENLKPLNVGILMFSDHIEKYFKYARIEVIDMPDPTGMNMTEKIFTGPIQKQLQDALLYIKNYVIKEVIIKEKNTAESIRIVNYPFSAIEELLSNAVYHRSYQINEPVTVKITPQSITIISFPGFDLSITDENIENYDISSSIYRNRRIGDYLKELHLIEGRNTGYPMIIKSLKDNKSNMPIIKMDPSRTYLSVTIPINDYFLPKESENPKKKDYEKKIVRILSNKPLSLTELSIEMGYKGITKKLSNTVNSLYNNDVIRKEVHDNSIKYVVNEW